MDGWTVDDARTAIVRAPAKINLSLHVVGRRADGYHLLDGLVAFAETGDVLAITEGRADQLTIDGPFAAGVPIEGNSISAALALARRIGAERGVLIPRLTIRLTKNLPAAAGIGGGSADAAALLRHVCERWPSLRARLASASATLGADVPMCLYGSPARTTGIGETIEPLAFMPRLHMVLVNPGTAVPTPSVFSRLGRADNPPPPAVPVDGFESLDAVVGYLKCCRNDLSEPAEAMAPSVTEAKALLSDRGARLSRMSGSGATVFGIFETADAAKTAAEAIRVTRPRWWVEPTRTFQSEREEDVA